MQNDTSINSAATAEDLQGRYRAETTEQFAALGRFVQAFELMVEAARTACIQLFPTSGNVEIAIQQQRMLRTFMCNQSVADLFRQHSSIYAELIKLMVKSIPDGEAQIVKKITSYIRAKATDLMQERNLLLHGTWYIGWASEADDDFSKIKANNWKASSAGLTSQKLPETVADLDQLSGRCEALTTLIERVCISFLHRGAGGPPPRVRHNVHKVGDVWLPSPPPPENAPKAEH